MISIDVLQVLKLAQFADHLSTFTTAIEVCVFGAGGTRFDPRPGQTNGLKIGFHSFPAFEREGL